MNIMTRHFIQIALLSLAVFATNRAHATTVVEEETNNFPHSANQVLLGTTGTPASITGFIGGNNSNGSGGADDSDFSKATNSAAYTSLKITITTDQSLNGNDFVRLKITGPGVNQNILTTNDGQGHYAASFTITNPQANGDYLVEVNGDISDGEMGYTLEYDPSPNMDLVAQINAKKSQISAKEMSIDDQESAIAKARKLSALLKKKAIKAKTKAAKLKLKKTLRKNEAKIDGYRVALAAYKGDLVALKSELAALQSML